MSDATIWPSVACSAAPRMSAALQAVPASAFSTAVARYATSPTPVMPIRSTAPSIFGPVGLAMAIATPTIE